MLLDVLDFPRKFIRVGEKNRISSMASVNEIECAAVSFGVNIPHSPFLTEMRIKRLNEERYEGQEIRGALHVVKKGDTVLELGAGLGFVGAAIAKNCKPKSVMSFEANPELIPHIENMYKINKIEKTIQVKNAALFSQSSPPKTVDFFLGKSFLGSSLSPDIRGAVKKVSIPTAEFSKVNKKLEANVLVLDIEGGELDFLDHADISGMRAIVIEFHPSIYGIEGMRKCKNILQNIGLNPHQELSTRTVWVCEKHS